MENCPSDIKIHVWPGSLFQQMHASDSQIYILTSTKSHRQRNRNRIEVNTHYIKYFMHFAQADAGKWHFSLVAICWAHWHALAVAEYGWVMRAPGCRKPFGFSLRSRVITSLTSLPCYCCSCLWMHIILNVPCCSLLRKHSSICSLPS